MLTAIMTVEPGHFASVSLILDCMLSDCQNFLSFELFKLLLLLWLHAKASCGSRGAGRSLVSEPPLTTPVGAAQDVASQSQAWRSYPELPIQLPFGDPTALHSLSFPALT